MQHEDPAITKAKHLWQQKQPKEAVLVLVRRVNELNSFLDAVGHSSVNRAALTVGQPVSVRVVWPKWLQWLKYITLAAIGLALLLAIALGLFLLFGKDRAVANYQLNIFCDYDLKQTDEVCEEWKTMVKKSYGDEARACAKEYESALDSRLFGDCLAGRGVPMPEN